MTGKAISVDHGARTLDVDAVRVVATRSHDKLDLRVYVPNHDQHPTMRRAARVALDNAVGEHDMVTRIDAIDWQPATHVPATARPLSELPAQIDATFAAR